MSMSGVLEPLALNARSLAFLLAEGHFGPLFDAESHGNGIVNFDPATMDAWDAKGNQVWWRATQTGPHQGVIMSQDVAGLLGVGFPQVPGQADTCTVPSLLSALDAMAADAGNGVIFATGGVGSDLSHDDLDIPSSMAA